MTVVHPNAVSGINSITVQTGNSLSIHKADGSLLRTITGSTGVTTFATASVGTAWTDFSQGGGLNIGLGASISNGSGNVLTFGTGGDDRATIDSSGRLLHGTASSRSIADGTPNVQVEGTAGTASLGLVRNQNNAGGSNISFAKSRGTSVGSATIVQDDDTLGNINFAAADGTDINTIAASIVAQVDGTPGANDMPGRLIFKTTADGANSATERVRIDSGGNFGIGSNNPQVLLHIASATPTLRIQDTTNNFYSHISVDDSGSLTLDGDAGNGAGSSRVVFKTDGSEHVRITNAGLVGVGTDTPVTESGWGNTLHIHTAASGSNVRFSDGTSKGTNSDGSLVGHYTNDLYLINKEATGSIIANTNGSERLRIDSSGRLLIGSTASNQVWGLQGALQVEGLTGDTATANFISNQNSNAPFYLNFCKTRGTSDGSATVVQNGDFLGTIAFAGADGTDRECVGGRIDCIVAAAPGGNDMPGKITFSTTADGAVSPTLALTLDQSQNATFAGSVTDSKGNLRSIPRNDKTSNYTAVAGDAGKVITTDISSSGQVTINASVFSEGDALTILNYGSAAITIVQGSGMAITNCADGATGNRTLASKGMATLYFLGSTGAAISGAGLS